MNHLKSLRHHPLVEEWIATYQNSKEIKDKDCAICGFPHRKNAICGSSATTFGELQVCGHTYYVDASNVEYFVKFREKTNAKNAFHWANDIYFQRTEKGDVKVVFYSPRNNIPQERVWIIPDGEWSSIVSFLETISKVR